MTTEQLFKELKQKDILLPKEILTDTSLSNLVNSLIEIFDNHREELEQDEKFRTNFTELINYVYLITLSEKPSTRNKNIFSNQLTSFLLRPAQAA